MTPDRRDIAELLSGDDFHYPNCPEYVAPGGDYEGESRFMEPTRLCSHDCIWTPWHQHRNHKGAKP